jgi:NAD(P)-dependent dehydrogenase (short-subunit alcohol dehydrogenase family)
MMTAPRVAESAAGKVILITGANRGIGYETARRLGELGATVLAGVRDVDRGEKAARQLRASGSAVRVVHLDVTDEQTIEATVKFVEAEFGRLDALVNNAGIGVEHGGPPSSSTPDMMRRTYETNVFGVVAVTRAMLPLLKESSAGRVVNLSAMIGSLTFNADPGHPAAQAKLLAYNSSKTALNAITLMYANELRGTGVLVNSADPGYVATDLNGHTGFRSVTEGAEIIVRLALLPADGPTGGFFNDGFLNKEGVTPW